MDGKAFVLTNIPASYCDEELITNYIEIADENITVEDVILSPLLPGTALIKTQDKIKDFTALWKAVQQHVPESQKLQLLKTHKCPATIVVNSDEDNLSEDQLNSYFIQAFASGQNAIESTKLSPGKKVAIVKFLPSYEKVLHRILREKQHVLSFPESCKISVSPFYSHFHESIETLLDLEEEENEEGYEDEDSAEEESEVCQSTDEEVRDDDSTEENGNEKTNTDEDDETEEEENEEVENEEMENEDHQLSDKETSDCDNVEESTEDEESEEEEENEKRSQAASKEKKALNKMKVHRKLKQEEVENDDSKHSKITKQWLKQRKEKSTLKEPVAEEKNVGRSSSNHIRSISGRGCLGHRGHFRDSFTNTGSEKDSSRGAMSNAYMQNKQRRSCDVTSEERGIGYNLSYEKKYESSQRRRGGGRGKGRGGSSLNTAHLRGHNSRTHKKDQSINERQELSLARGDNTEASFSGRAWLSHSSVKSYLCNKVESEFHRNDDSSTVISHKRQELTVESHSRHSANQKDQEETLRLLEEEVRKAEEENARLKEKPNFVTEKLDLEPWQVELLPHCFGKFDECNVTYDEYEKHIILTGPEDQIKKHQIEMLQEIRKLNTCTENIELSPTTVVLLSRTEGKQFLENFSANHKTKIFLHENNMIVVTDGTDDQDIIDELRQRIAHKGNWSTESGIPLDKLTALQANLEHTLLVKMSWDDGCKEIVCEGIKDDVMMARHDIEMLINDTAVQVKKYTIKYPDVKYFDKFYMDKMSTYLEGVQLVNRDTAEDKVTISFKGTREQMNQAHERLHNLMINVNSDTWDIRSEFDDGIEAALITNAFKLSKELHDKVEHLELTNRCCVIRQFVSADEESGPKYTRKSQKTQQHKKESKFSVKVTSTCQLVIKSYGNIVKEQSEMLVCLLTQHVDLRRTGVGKAFNKACPSLWKQLAAEKEAKASDSVLVTQGQFEGLNCQAICYIVLSSWDPSSSPAQLDKAVKLVLDRAVSLNVTSVSFPVLGCGRAHQFPPDVVAQTFLSNMTSTNIGGNLREIVFLATEQSLYSELQSKAQKFQVSDVKAGGNQTDASDGEVKEVEINVLPCTPKLQSSNYLKISIVADGDVQCIWQKLKKIIKDICLCDTDFTPHKILWPSESEQSIMHEAARLFVWVEMYRIPRDEIPQFVLKGEKNAIFQMKEFIDREYVKISQIRPKGGLKSSQAPPRGTVEFLKYAMDNDEKYPSYWKLNNAKSKENTDQQHDGAGANPGAQSLLVDVDSKTKTAIIQLVRDTLDNAKIGHGNDARNLAYNNIEVLKVERVENPHLFEIYQTQRRRLFRKIAQQGHICHNVGDTSKYPKSKGEIVSTAKLDASLKEELYHEINEYYLFHGAPKNVIPAMIYSGLDPRVSSEKCLFGKGIYAAEKFTKSDQYADDRDNRKRLGTELAIILTRMLLGNPYFCDENHKTVKNNKQGMKLVRPPCMNCGEDNCTCGKEELHDSVIGDGKWIFREFVAYDSSQCYPEYIITYKRV